jgi:hypothetical protein
VPFAKLACTTLRADSSTLILLALLLQIQAHGAYEEATYTDDRAVWLVSVDGATFGSQTDVFPVTAPLRPIKRTGQDRQNSHPVCIAVAAEARKSKQPEIRQQHGNTMTLARVELSASQSVSVCRPTEDLSGADPEVLAL